MTDKQYDKDLLKDPDKLAEELARFNWEIETFREPMKHQAQNVKYFEGMVELEEATIRRDPQIVAELKLLPNKEDREAEIHLQVDERTKDDDTPNGIYSALIDSRAVLAGYEKAIQAIDIQRSNVQSAIKLHERKR